MVPQLVPWVELEPTVSSLEASSLLVISQGWTCFCKEHRAPSVSTTDMVVSSCWRSLEVPTLILPDSASHLLWGRLAMVALQTWSLDILGWPPAPSQPFPLPLCAAVLSSCEKVYSSDLSPSESPVASSASCKHLEVELLPITHMAWSAAGCSCTRRSPSSGQCQGLELDGSEHRLARVRKELQPVSLAF